MDLQQLDQVPADLAAGNAELEWRDTESPGTGAPARRTGDRRAETFLRRAIRVRDVLGVMWQAVDGIDPDDVQDLFYDLDAAVADFRGDRDAVQLELVEAVES